MASLHDATELPQALISTKPTVLYAQGRTSLDHTYAASKSTTLSRAAAAIPRYYCTRESLANSYCFSIILGLCRHSLGSLLQTWSTAYHHLMSWMMPLIQAPPPRQTRHLACALHQRMRQLGHHLGVDLCLPRHLLVLVLPPGQHHMQPGHDRALQSVC